MAMFDPKVSITEKRKIARTLRSYTQSDEDRIASKKYSMNPGNIENFCRINLHDFVTPNTVTFFERFNIDFESFLVKNPDDWPNDEAERRLKSLRVVIMTMQNVESKCWGTFINY